VLFLSKEIFQRLIAAFPEIREYVSGLGEERQMDTRLLLETVGDEEVFEVDVLV
jgi:hypothetical protein